MFGLFIICVFINIKSGRDGASWTIGSQTAE